MVSSREIVRSAAKESVDTVIVLISGFVYEQLLSKWLYACAYPSVVVVVGSGQLSICCSLSLTSL